MAKTIILDFLHYYRIGERREASSLAYQWDKGHVLEARLPKGTDYQLHYHMFGMELADGYAPARIDEADEGYVLTARIPNTYFTSSGDLLVYLVSAGDDDLTTTYEGVIHIRSRAQPTDYVDYDPENGAKDLYVSTLANARACEAWANGTINDIPVTPDAEQYQNNAKYYAQQNAASVAAVAESALAASTAAESAAGSAEEAAGSADAVAAYAEAAAGSAETAQAAAEAAQQAAAEAGAEDYLDTSEIHFEQAETRENIENSDVLSVLFGKIKKWFADLGAAAFASIANNLSTEIEGSVLDARQGKELADRLTTDESAISGHASTLTSHSNSISSLSSSVSSNASAISAQGSRIAALETAVDSGKINSYVGMVIYSTKLDTAAKVKAIYGGTTWTQLKDRVLIGASTTYANGSTGGAKSVTYKPSGTVGGHTLTESEIPAHSHAVYGTAKWLGGTATASHVTMEKPGTTTEGYYSGNTGGGKSHSHSFTGTSATIATMPPYRAVYIWERTA